jgi:hypothetical protein
VEHVGYIYKDEDRVNISKVMNMTPYFPIFVDDLGNEIMIEEITKAEL